MEITIDVDRLRKDLINYYGTAREFIPAATGDLINIENLSDKKIVEIAIENGINIWDYEIKDNSLRYHR